MRSETLGSRPGLLARLRGTLFVRRIRRRPAALLAFTCLIVIVLAATFAPLIAPFNPYDLASLDLLDSHLPPAMAAGGDPRHLLGSDSQGADIASLVLYGLRSSLLVGILAVAISASVGTMAGLVSGYLGGRWDSVIMRAADVQFTFPALLLALLIGGITQSLLSTELRATLAMPVLILALGISHWPHFARLVRGACMVERQRDYVAAATLAGRGAFFIMTRQLLPNVLNPIFVLVTLDVAFAIMSEATLSFLGFGMPSTQPSLGTLIRTGYTYLFSGEWWVVIFPGLMLVILLVSINVFGDWLRDILDPRLH